MTKGLDTDSLVGHFEAAVRSVRRVTGRFARRADVHGVFGTNGDARAEQLSVLRLYDVAPHKDPPAVPRGRFLGVFLDSPSPAEVITP